MSTPAATPQAPIQNTDPDQQPDQQQYSVPDPVAPQPSPQGAPLTSAQNPTGVQDPSLQTQNPQVSAQAGQIQNPTAAPASTMQAPPRVLTHTQRLLQTARAISESMIPGGLYKTTINDDGTTTRTEQPVSGRSIGLAIALEALTGGLAGAGAHGPNAIGQAAAAGLQQGQQIAQQHAQQQAQLDQQAQTDLNTRYQTLKNNLTLSTQARALSKADEQDHIDAESQARPLYEAAQHAGAIVADNLEDVDALDHKKYPIDQFDRYLVGHHIANDADGHQISMIPGSGRIVPEGTAGSIPKYVNTWAIADRHKFTLGEDGTNLPFWDSQVRRGGILGNQPGTARGQITSVQAASLQAKDAVTNAAVNDINRVRTDQGEPEINLDSTMKKNGSLQDALGLFQTQLGVNGHQYTGALQAVQAKYPDSAAIIAQSYGGIKALQQIDLTTAQHDRENGYRTNGFKNPDEATQVLTNPNSSPDVKSQAKSYIATAGTQKANEAGAVARAEENARLPGELQLASARANNSGAATPDAIQQTAEGVANGELTLDTITDRPTRSKVEAYLTQHHSNLDQNSVTLTPDERKKKQLASADLLNLGVIKDVLTRRPELVGALAGRVTNGQWAVGTNDPDLTRLRLAYDNYALPAVGIHGSRSVLNKEQAVDVLSNHNKNGAQAVLAGVTDAENSANVFHNAGQPRGKNGSLYIVTPTPQTPGQVIDLSTAQKYVQKYGKAAAQAAAQKDGWALPAPQTGGK